MSTSNNIFAWKCCKCKTITHIYDNNHAWINRNTEQCTKSTCSHKRCNACFDLSNTYWPLQYCDGKKLLNFPSEHNDPNEEYETYAWRCCQCELATVIHDGNHAWINNIAEECTSVYCFHKRCNKCRDLDSQYRLFQHCDGTKL